LNSIIGVFGGHDIAVPAVVNHDNRAAETLNHSANSRYKAVHIARAIFVAVSEVPCKGIRHNNLDTEFACCFGYGIASC
tara:strand:+ start:8139 stop:8375 length:237 start_codon:yes stop_codon:yes gene_type:complete